MITTKDIIIDPHATLRARAEEVKSPISDEDKAILRGLLEYVIASQDDEKAERSSQKIQFLMHCIIQKLSQTQLQNVT